MREAENWIIILVSGKGEKSAGKCCVTRQNINIYKIIIFSFLYLHVCELLIAAFSHGYIVPYMLRNGILYFVFVILSLS